VELVQRMAATELWLCDVDGVLTDGRIVLDNAGNELKSFDVRDGHGLVMLRQAGVRLGLITGRRSVAVDRRAEELGFQWVHQGSRDKFADLQTIAAEAQVPFERIAFMGDDVIDLPVLRRVGLAIAPGDAHAVVRSHVHMITQAAGGRGAVREAAEQILQAKGLWQPMLDGFLEV
jgi:3-deoxy-D-manno-octulosonate 8-phosphate phosphatase (KDO 8-P phosphatase)